MSAEVIIGDKRLAPHRLRAAILGEVHARPFRALATPARILHFAFDTVGEQAHHDRKALTHILETYPRDELLQIGVDDLTEIVRGVLNLQERQRTALFIRRDAFDRFASVLVYVPRDRYDTELRRRMARILEEELGGEIASFATHIGDDPLARVHFTVT